MKIYLYRKHIDIAKTCKQYIHTIIDSEVISPLQLNTIIKTPPWGLPTTLGQQERGILPSTLMTQSLGIMASCRILEHGTWDNDALRGA